MRTIPIKDALESVYNNIELLDFLKKQLNTREYSNKDDIEKVYGLFNGD